MTPDIETLIERLIDVTAITDEQQLAVDDAIRALRAVQWRPISEAPDKGRLFVQFNTGDVDLVGGLSELREIEQMSGGEEFGVLFMLAPLPAARASKEG